MLKRQITQFLEEAQSSFMPTLSQIKQTIKMEEETKESFPLVPEPKKMFL